MIVKIQFKDVEPGVCKLVSDVDKFQPEMSLPIEQILLQYSYIDNIRMAEMARQGYEYANKNDEDFDVEDFDTLDPAEKEEIYSRASDIVNRYRAQMARQKENPEVTDDSVDESVLP